MDNASIVAQLIVSISVFSVWVFRYDNIVLEFKQYGISNLLRNIVGASKISLATILILGIWYSCDVGCHLLVHFLNIGLHPNVLFH